MCLYFRKPLLCWAVLVLLQSSTALAQGLTVNALQTAPGLTRLAHGAGYIFSGTVQSVDRVAPSGSNQVGAVRITFQVEQAIRGVRHGQILVIQEWTGLWESGQRFRPGERLLLFLYGPSRLGLTSIVGGPLGRFRLDRNGQVILLPTQVNALWPPATVGIRRPPNPDPVLSPQDFARALWVVGKE